MTILHNLLLTAEITSGSIAGLLALGLSTATIRAVFGVKDIPASQAIIPIEEAKAAAEPYWHRVLVAFDICMNVWFWKGQQDETISTHSWRAANEGHWWGIAMNWWLNLFQKDHGFKAACGDLQRAVTRVAFLKKALNLN